MNGERCINESKGKADHMSPDNHEHRHNPQQINAEIASFRNARYAHNALMSAIRENMSFDLRHGGLRPGVDLAFGGVEIAPYKDNGQLAALELLVVVPILDLRYGLAGGLVELELENIDCFRSTDVGVDAPLVGL